MTRHKKVEDRELGWLEGMIDGEGCLSISRNKSRELRRGFSYRCRLSFGQTDPYSIPRIMEIISKLTGLKYVGKIRHLPSETHKPQERIWFEASVLRCLLPQLRLTVKERQRLLILEMLEILKQNKKGKLVNEKRLEEIYREVRRLNRRKGGGRAMRHKK